LLPGRVDLLNEGVLPMDVAGRGQTEVARPFKLIDVEVVWVAAPPEAGEDIHIIKMTKMTMWDPAGVLELGSNLGPRSPKHLAKRGSGRYQKARRVNHVDKSRSVCKTSIPGSNPGGASKFPR
jgi:hypothetical protein